MAHDVFVSYASEDKTVADAACAMLESRAVRCWIAPRDVIPGVAYGEAIIDAIRGCRIMILIFSSKSNKSPHIPKEIERAVSAGVAVIPFRIEDVKPGKSLDYFIGSVHWLDALTPPLEQHLERLVHNVKTLLSRDVTVTEGKSSFAAAASAPSAAAGAASSAARSVAASAPAQPARSPLLYILLGVLAVVAVVFAVLYFARKPATIAQIAPATVSVTSPVAGQPPAAPAPQSSGVATAAPSITPPRAAGTPAAAAPKPAAAVAASQTPRKEPATVAHDNAPVPKQPETPASFPATPPIAAAGLFDQALASYKNKDLSQAAGLYQKACDGGERRGCTNLGLMYYNADGMPKDLDRAAGLFKRACDADGPGGCMNLGLMYLRGESVAKDPHRAAELLERACDTNVAAACTNLGIMYARGENLPQDLKRAADLYTRACNGNHPIGCNFLGLLYEHGRGVPKDLSRANELFKKACAAGLDQGCDNLARPTKQRRD